MYSFTYFGVKYTKVYLNSLHFENIISTFRQCPWTSRPST